MILHLNTCTISDDSSSLVPASGTWWPPSWGMLLSVKALVKENHHHYPNKPGFSFMGTLCTQCSRKRIVSGLPSHVDIRTHHLVEPAPSSTIRLIIIWVYKTIIIMALYIMHTCWFIRRHVPCIHFTLLCVCQVVWKNFLVRVKIQYNQNFGYFPWFSI